MGVAEEDGGKVKGSIVISFPFFAVAAEVEGNEAGLEDLDMREEDTHYFGGFGKFCGTCVGGMDILEEFLALISSPKFLRRRATYLS